MGNREFFRTPSDDECKEMNREIIAGIKRASRFSPNHIGNDAAIFDLTVGWLQEHGYTVREYTEEEFIRNGVVEKIVFNMSREEASVSRLKELEDRGCVVVNSGYGISNCGREQMTRLLLEHHVPYPESFIVETGDCTVVSELIARGFRNCWIKRDDFHAIHKEDVSYVRHPEEARSILSEYAMRGIRRAVINRHLDGDLIKFYGVTGSDFFYWFYPFDTHHSKFGYEEINGKSTGIPFSVEEMKAICMEAAGVLNVKIYGGDCIISPEGEVRIIDFNDWPSFAPCRDEAAPYIGACIEAEIKKYAHPVYVAV